MQYDLRIGDSEQPTQATGPDDDGRVGITLGENTRNVTVQKVAPHQLRVTEQGRGADLFAARSPDGVWIWSAGRARLVQDTATLPTARRGTDGGVGKSVTPPMPAVVQAVLVAVGQAVEKNQALVVVSAMKMESTLVAPHAGTVEAVNTEVGAKVNPGEILVEIAEAAPEDAGKEESPHE